MCLGETGSSDLTVTLEAMLSVRDGMWRPLYCYCRRCGPRRGVTRTWAIEMQRGSSWRRRIRSREWYAR